MTKTDSRTRTTRNVWLSMPALLRVGLSAVVGIAASVAIGRYLSWSVAPLIFWDVTALISISALWFSIRGMDAAETKRNATDEDPGRGLAGVVLLCASAASLAAVLVLLVQASQANGVERLLDVALGILSVVISWTVVHIVYMLRYADLYFDTGDGIDFNTDAPPTYQDFAYVAFTIGMTYQVSDTSLKTTALRHVARQHAMLSFVFGTAIIATTINALAGLGK